MKILVVDDHPIVRQGIRHLLTSQIAGAEVHEAGAIEPALEQARAAAPDVAIVDLSLGAEFGIDLIRGLLKEHPDTRVLVLSVFDENLYAQRALRAGARGYVMKELAADELVESVFRIARGELVLSRAVQSQLLDTFVSGTEQITPAESLSRRELEILEMIGHGLSTQTIAERIVRSVKTVEAHRTNIQRKLNLGSAAQLVRYATLWAERGVGPQENP